MKHEVHRVVAFEHLDTFKLRVEFADATEQVIDFEPVIGRGIFAPLADAEYFAQVWLDPELGTLVWPNGADFDPETLHDWPAHADELAERVRSWDALPTGT